MKDRTLAALGLNVVPREHPLEYPGAWPRESGLLDGDRLLPLDRWAFEDRVPVIGVLAAPMRGELWTAAVGQGSWRNGTRLRVAPRADLAGARVPADQLPKADQDLVMVAKPNSIALRIALVAAVRSGR